MKNVNDEIWNVYPVRGAYWLKREISMLNIELVFIRDFSTVKIII